MKRVNAVTNTWSFWNSLGTIGKHVVAIIVCFISIAVGVVLSKLGLKDVAKFVLLVGGAFGFWGFGYWYLLTGLFKLILQGITIVPK
jgi:hypothetical protein